ncbi:oys [Drosophila busckii]|uniref:Oys n=1 Tax=Drosophila busckii TaxID=30019 RepID=A0A0M5IZS9_DROBS|nr:lysophospholipid acyltransferase 1 [Drosophila busckii]XP_017837752.1 lysophospholipid acyltransferase 1 [Drosophila busckii]ALC41198.1 oys [Drosophila busckii]
MLESPKFVENDLYDGSRMFTWVADAVGLSVDLVNFLICQISALFLASLFRSLLHPSKVSCGVRHTVALSLGLAFGYFIFGQQAIHIAGLPAICYIVIRTQHPRIVQRSVLLVAMGYLLCVHLMRQLYDYGSYALDITGPLMIITQKVTSLAFSIHDGFVRKDEELTKAQQYHAIRKIPSALEYFSYVWHFQSLMAGPLVFYKDYIEFVEGYNLLKRPPTNATLDNGKTELIVEPSPTKTVIRKVIGSLVCAFIFMKFVKMYPVKNMKEDEFINDTRMAYKFWYAMMATTCIRFKYYHAWLLADAICNNSGLGFSGYDKDGNAKWDLISNINVLSFEFASNMRDAINNWNIGTNRWLRTLVYERVPKQYGTLLTFALSAVWHGFYPGYYLTFATGAVIVTAGRSARRMFRHRFQSTQFTRMFYDILTIITTRIVMGYATFPFVLLEFMASIKLYLRFFLCLHLISLVAIFILPRFIKGERGSRSQHRQSAGSEQVNSTAIESQALAHGADLKTAQKQQPEQLEQKLAEDQQQQQQQLDEPHTPPNIILTPRPQPQQPSPSSPKPLSQPCPRDAVSVPHDQCEMDQLSSKLKEKIEAETKNIEEFIDKTVTETVSGIVEFKNDLMRDIEFPKLKLPAGSGAANLVDAAAAGLRKRNISTVHDNNAGATNGCVQEEDSAAFLKKEIEVINAVVQQSVVPAVLSNGHAK